MIKMLSEHFRECIWKHSHKIRCKEWRNRFRNSEVTILSMNCTGGILYHDLGLQFRSPTINLFMRAEDFIKFCEKLNYYLSIDEMRECHDPNIIEERKYPIAYLGDLTLFLVHYASVAEAQEKWNERKKRVNWDNIAVLNTDREGMTEELKDRFEALPYRKIMFVNRPDPMHPSTYYIHGYEDQPCVGIITEHIGWSGYRPIDQVNWVSFLNGEDMK